MNKEEYKYLMGVSSEEEKKNIAREYAFSHKEFGIGDFVKDKKGYILIDKICFSYCRDIFSILPYCIYEGYEYTIHLEKKKVEKRRRVYPQDIIDFKRK